MPHTESRSHRSNFKRSGQTDRLLAGPEALFVYGSLLFPEVFRALIDRVPDSTPAGVMGWRVAALPGRVYPVLVPGEAIARGKLITGLSAEEWRTIDAFEDKVYELRHLTTTDGHDGCAYATNDVFSALPYDWDIDAFAAKELSAYTSRCATWRMKYEWVIGKQDTRDN